VCNNTNACEDKQDQTNDLQLMITGDKEHV